MGGHHPVGAARLAVGTDPANPRRRCHAVAPAPLAATSEQPSVTRSEVGAPYPASDDPESDGSRHSDRSSSQPPSRLSVALRAGHLVDRLGLWQLCRDLDLLAHRADSLDVTKGPVVTISCSRN